MPPETTHPSLLERLRNAADAAAWREFEARYRDLILRYCRRRGLQTADAEDVCQLVLLALSKALPGFRYDPALGRFRDYLGRVVQNAIQRHRSRPGAARDLLDPSMLESLVTPDVSPLDEHWESEWMLHHLRLALESVRATSEAQSIGVFQRLLAGESVQEVAAGLQMTPDAVHK